jgi:hypothetical protein
MKQKNHIILCVIITLFIAGCIPQTAQVTRLPKSEKTPKVKQESPKKACHLNETKPRPSWIDHPPKTDQFLFGIGAAPKQMPISRQIHAARTLAMGDISSQIQVHIKSLFQETLTQDNSDIQSQIQQKSEALLRGIDYVDQWNDMSSCTIYVLASVALNNAPAVNQSIHIQPQELRKSALIRNIKAEGACLIAGISPKQAETIAIQRARASAIRNACGDEIVASRVVKESTLVLDFIRSYSKGYIVREEVTWHPARQFQKSTDSPPILEYHVSILVDVYVPQKLPDQTGLSAQLNKSIFTRGERAILSIHAQKACQIAVFNIMADDQVVMLHPHPMRPLKTLIPNHVFKIDNLFPEPLAGEKHNVEALFICASMSKGLDFQSLFPVDKAMSFVEFFKRYAQIADLCIDRLIPYEVMSLDSAK